MVVCKYFLQGTCKFGSQCHYDHQIPSNYNYNYQTYTDPQQKSTSILRQTSFGATPTQGNLRPNVGTTNIDVSQILKPVAVDMLGVEKGGQWPLSCYAPMKEKPAVPGFEDHSPEEIRFGFYQAQKNGTLDQYKQQLQLIIQDTLMKVKALQNPSPETIAILQNILNSPARSCSGTYGQNSTTSTNAFNQQPSNNIFSQQQPNNIFAQSQTKSIFGQVTGQQTDNIFAAASKSILGGNSMQTNDFASKPPMDNMFANQSNNMFSAQPPNPPAFSNMAPTNIFASPTQSQNIFTPQPPLFQQPHNQQNIFATNKPVENPFVPQLTQQQQSNSPLQQNVPPPNYSASIFGNLANTNPTLNLAPAPSQTINENLYSKLEELTEEERKWFESDNFDIMTIPDKPPTYEMCF